MARLEHTGPEPRVGKQWMGEFMRPHHLMPSGGRLDASAYSVGSNGKRFIPAGTLVGRVRGTDRLYGPVTFNMGEPEQDEVFLTAHDVLDADANPDVALVRHRFLVRYEMLPGWGDLSADHKALILKLYDPLIIQSGS